MRTIRNARERRARNASLEFLADRELAERVDCPVCAQPAGETCINPSTGNTVRYPAHWQRLREGNRT